MNHSNDFHNFDEFSYRKNLIPTDKVEKEKFFKDLGEKFLKQLENTEKVKSYLNKFSDYNKEKFLPGYIDYKINLIKFYDYYLGLINEKERSELQYQREAEKAFKSILQKKLFNIELQWMARKIEIEDIKTSFDLIYWRMNILLCPFIPKITKHEIQLMKEFILSLDDPRGPDSYKADASHYDQLMEKDENGDYPNMPAWYEFYDSRMGTNMLLLLPDLRSNKEKMYKNLAQEQYKKENPAPAKKAESRPVDKRPLLDYNGQPLIDFARFIEHDKYILRLFDGLEIQFKKHSDESQSLDLEMAIEILKSTDRPVYFDSTLNWYKAIYKAAFKYENQKTAEALDFVYDQYLMMKELGISPEKDDPYNVLDIYEKIKRETREAILKGRELNGEPRDFNF